MRTIRMLSVLTLAGFVLFAAVPGEAQSGRVAKKAAAPDAVDLNTASAEQMTKLGLDEATQQKVVAGRPYSGLDDAKLKEAIPASVLSKLEGKVTVKPKAK